MTLEKNSEKDVLSGKAIEIYTYLREHGPSGVREIQKALKLSSPSSVSYHINKMVQAEIVGQNTEGKYQITKEVETEIFRLLDDMFFRFCLYLSYFGTILVLVTFFLLIDVRIHSLLPLFFVIFTSIGTGIFLFELYLIYQKRSKLKF